jgi:hypothetical protein
MTHDPQYDGPIAPIMERVEGGVGTHKVGLIVAPAGVGKSSLLIHLGLDALLGGKVVLHVTAQERIEEVRRKYEQAFRVATGPSFAHGGESVLHSSERNRMIHSYRERAFEVAHFRNNLEMLAEVAQFRPAVILIDGLSERVFQSQLEALHVLAVDKELAIWVTTRSEPKVDTLAPALWPHIEVALRLRPLARTVEVEQFVSGGAPRSLGVHLDVATGLVVDAFGHRVETAPAPLRMVDCTLFSGGARGSEAAFGAIAADYGIPEVNFTFEGHKQERVVGRYLLSESELRAGNVSLVYVSNRLNRVYSEGSLIRRVLQTLWHMVSRSQQIFVIGEIQEDGTVVGGTGWSVELARMWDKDLWVFDQARLAWYQWTSQDWVRGTPTISEAHYCGTGTRYLTDAGKAAIEDLYRRSFAKSAG